MGTFAYGLWTTVTSVPTKYRTSSEAYRDYYVVGYVSSTHMDRARGFPDSDSSVQGIKGVFTVQWISLPLQTRRPQDLYTRKHTVRQLTEKRGIVARMYTLKGCECFWEENAQASLASLASLTSLASLVCRRFLPEPPDLRVY